MRNAAVLEAIADPDFQTELGQFNVEINIPPRLLEPAVFARARGDGPRGPQRGGEQGPRARTARMVHDRHPADGRRGAHGRRALLATTRATRCSTSRSSRRAGRTSTSPSTASSGCRPTRDTILPEAACTSVQLHQQIDPTSFAAHWNAAQAIAGIQLAVGANSPFLFGRELWRETRIALFEQATDTRLGGAQGAGRAPARVVRRALDHRRSSTSSRRTSATSRRCCR